MYVKRNVTLGTCLQEFYFSAPRRVSVGENRELGMPKSGRRMSLPVSISCCLELLHGFVSGFLAPAGWRVGYFGTVSVDKMREQ
jgi:hypothetical protein